MPKITGDPDAPEARAILRVLVEVWPVWMQTRQFGYPPEVRPHLEALLAAEMIEQHPWGDDYEWRAVR